MPKTMRLREASCYVADTSTRPSPLAAFALSCWPNCLCTLLPLLLHLHQHLHLPTGPSASAPPCWPAQHSCLTNTWLTFSCLMEQKFAQPSRSLCICPLACCLCIQLPCLCLCISLCISLLTGTREKLTSKKPICMHRHTLAPHAPGRCAASGCPC